MIPIPQDQEKGRWNLEEAHMLQFTGSAAVYENQSHISH